MLELEHIEQASLIEWAHSQLELIPELANLFAIPNGGHRHPAVARKLRLEGVSPGVPDLFLAQPRGDYHGLFIEMKSAKGKASPIQKLWLKNLDSAGYCCCIAYSADEAISDISSYLALPAPT